jgi:hypothetical protein
MMTYRGWVSVAAALMTTALTVPCKAAEDCLPGEFLTISGKIKRFTDAKRKVYVFSETDLINLPPTKIRTSSVWTPVSDWTGPSLKSILDKVGVEQSATKLHPIALDEFASTIPLQDIGKYEPVVAHSRDGKRLLDAKYGPMFIVYPRDSHPELQNPTAETKFVWALCKIEVL